MESGNQKCQEKITVKNYVQSSISVQILVKIHLSIRMNNHLMSSHL